MITVGQSLPAGEFTFITAEGKQVKDTQALFADKRVVLFAVPGAFTPTCSVKHLPGYLDKAAELKARGVDEIACVAVNDAFVMGAWGKSSGADGKVTMLADGNGDLARAIGLTLDLGKMGLGIRSQRYSMLVKDGKVAILNIEGPGEFRLSSAEHLLSQL